MSSVPPSGGDHLGLPSRSPRPTRKARRPNRALEPSVPSPAFEHPPRPAPFYQKAGGPLRLRARRNGEIIFILISSCTVMPDWRANIRVPGPQHTGLSPLLDLHIDLVRLRLSSYWPHSPAPRPSHRPLESSIFSPVQDGFCADTSVGWAVITGTTTRFLFQIGRGTPPFGFRPPENGSFSPFAAWARARTSALGLPPPGPIWFSRRYFWPAWEKNVKGREYNSPGFCPGLPDTLCQRSRRAFFSTARFGSPHPTLGGGCPSPAGEGLSRGPCCSADHLRQEAAPPAGGIKDPPVPLRRGDFWAFVRSPMGRMAMLLFLSGPVLD